MSDRPGESPSGAAAPGALCRPRNGAWNRARLARGAAKAPAEGGTVLVIDDDDDIRDNLGEILENEGYVCWLASSADDACQLFADDDASPDVILLDWTLPGMEAGEFVSLVRSRAGWASAPIVLETGAAECDIPERLPVDAIVRKPFDVPALLALVHEIIASRAGAAGAAPARRHAGESE